MTTMTGVELISAERARQVSKEGWTAEHDDCHTSGELARAAVCYASPCPVYVTEYRFGGYAFADPWPWTDDGSDKRQWWDGSPQHAASYSKDKRIRLLVKAGALIAAEIDRLQRVKDGK